MLMVLSLAAYSQKATLYTVNTVKPKKGQKMAFEAAYKQHVAKFHASDSKVNVYEIMSGPNAGAYQIVEGGKSYADFDSTRPDAPAHNLDLDKNYFPLLEETMNATYVRIDSLSFRGDVTAESFIVNVRHLKQSLNQNDYRREQARAVKVLSNLKGGFWENFSFGYFEQLWDGSDPVTVTVRNLKDGFKSLERGFYGTGGGNNPSFRDEYVKLYGHSVWDERVKLMEGAVESTEPYIMKLRKDLSSK